MAASKSMKSWPRVWAFTSGISIVMFGRLFWVRELSVACFSMWRSWVKVSDFWRAVSGIWISGPGFSALIKMMSLLFGPSLYNCD